VVAHHSPSQSRNSTRPRLGSVQVPRALAVSVSFRNRWASAGVPVLAYVRTCYAKERPVRLTETTFVGDRNRLVYELGDLDALYERDQ
jgi:hypothetical protein